MIEKKVGKWPINFARDSEAAVPNTGMYTAIMWLRTAWDDLTPQMMDDNCLNKVRTLPMIMVAIE